MDFNQVQELIRLVSKQKISEFILKDGEFKITIRNQTSADASVPAQLVMPAVQPVATVMPQPQARVEAPATPAEKPATPAGEEAAGNLITVKSPMVGTFYRSPSPDKPPFVKVGDVIEVGTPVCIIEAMKLFNEIESDLKGKIVKVLVEDAAPVEYEQPLFLIDPS